MSHISVSVAVKFVDPFGKFFGNDKLYAVDWVHLKNRGSFTLAKLIDQNAYWLMEETPTLPIKSQETEQDDGRVEKRGANVPEGRDRGAEWW